MYIVPHIVLYTYPIYCSYATIYYYNLVIYSPYNGHTLLKYYHVYCPTHTLFHILFIYFLAYCPFLIYKCVVYTNVSMYNTELAIYALDQVHCWGAYFRPGIDTKKILPP
jgi:hypothetical protein